MENSSSTANQNTAQNKDAVLKEICAKWSEPLTAGKLVGTMLVMFGVYLVAA